MSCACCLALHLDLQTADCVNICVLLRLTLDEKYQLCRSIGAECIQDEELRNLLEKKPNPVAYDGFEPSGRMHIAQVCLHSCLTGLSNSLLRLNILCLAGCFEGFECEQTD